MFYLVDKPIGLSSFFALGKIRYILGVKKIGHTGTLDPLASGLLMVATEGSTKLIPYLENDRKTYEFSVDFSRSSASYDLDTEVVEIPEESKAKLSDIQKEEIEAILLEFRGKINQTPPLYSAIRIDGKRAYRLARDGKTEEEIVIKSREVEVHSLELLSWNTPIIQLRAEVSAGTYIRSLGRDISKALANRYGTPGEFGYLITELRRTKINHFDVKDATARNSFEVDTKPLSYEELFPGFGIIEVPLTEKQTLIHGNPVSLDICKLQREAQESLPYFIKCEDEYGFLWEIHNNTVKPTRGKIT